MSYEHVKAFRLRVKAAIVAGMGGKCRICGYERCHKALAAHHLDPAEKEFGVVSWASMNTEKILKEMKKCVLLCMNCHTEVHAGLASVQGLLPIFDEEAATPLLGCISKLRRLERQARAVPPVAPKPLIWEGKDWGALLVEHGDKRAVAAAVGVSYSTVRRVYAKLGVIHRRSG